MRRKKIGTMDFHGSVDITDPCYNRDVWCRMTDVKIRNGVYLSEAETAKRLNCSLQYVRNQRCIALKRLRSRLMEGGDDE